VSGIPYNELQDVNCTVNDTDGTKHTIATLHYAFVIPCRDCKHYREHAWFGIKGTPLGTDVEHACMFFSDGVKVDPDGFCAWGERRDA